MADSASAASAAVVAGPTDPALEDFKTKVSTFITEVKEDAKGGYTLAEIGKDSYDFIHLAVDELNAVKILTGDQKKALAMNGLGELFDVLWPVVPLPMPLQPFRGVEGKILRPMFLAIGDGIIEGIVSTLHTKTPTTSTT